MTAFYMELRRDTTSARARRAAALCVSAIAASIVMTWPLITGMDRLGRTANSADARMSVWNVAWVAHAALTDPANIFDTNIYYPHTNTLAYSEANLVAGVLAIPCVVALTQRRNRSQRRRPVCLCVVGRDDVAVRQAIDG
jgi:hypothetical protein